MAMTKDQLLSEAMELDVKTREELADAIWLSTCGLSREEIDAAWAAEARRRLDQIGRGEVQTIPGDEVMREARRLVGKTPRP